MDIRAERWCLTLFTLHSVLWFNLENLSYIIGFLLDTAAEFVLKLCKLFCLQVTWQKPVMSWGPLKSSSTNQGWWVWLFLLDSVMSYSNTCVNSLIGDSSSGFSSGNHVFTRRRHRRRYRRLQTSYRALPVWAGLCPVFLFIYFRTDWACAAGRHS